MTDTEVVLTWDALLGLLDFIHFVDGHLVNESCWEALPPDERLRIVEQYLSLEAPGPPGLPA